MNKFIIRWNSRTRKSKAYASEYRETLADWIVSLNFSRSIKELVYPLVSAESQGSKFWDVDGNEYLDTAMGYGVSFFGHKPEFIIEAIRNQLDKGFELGPQSQLVGEVTMLIRELTDVERVAYCNTGTEAVMVALRLARSVSGRSMIAKFTNSFHGSFDGVLAEADGGYSQPMTSGIPQSMVEDTVVLRYGSEGIPCGYPQTWVGVGSRIGRACPKPESRASTKGIFTSSKGYLFRVWHRFDF